MSRPTGTPSTRRSERAPEVGQQQHPHQRSALGDPAGRADPALPLEAHHARARAHRSLDHVIGRRRVRQRTGRIRRLDLHHARVVQPAVVAFRHDRDHHLVDAHARVGIDGGRHRAVVDAPDRHRRGQVDRRLEPAPLADHERARHLTGAVEHGHARPGSARPRACPGRPGGSPSRRSGRRRGRPAGRARRAPPSRGRPSRRPRPRSSRRGPARARRCEGRARAGS